VLPSRSGRRRWLMRRTVNGLAGLRLARPNSVRMDVRPFDGIIAAEGYPH
jgi:hypothetical protein